MHLLKMMLKATGDKGVPQGGVISPMRNAAINSTVPAVFIRGGASVIYLLRFGCGNSVRQFAGCPV
jgi:hypothetical protein